MDTVEEGTQRPVHIDGTIFVVLEGQDKKALHVLDSSHGAIVANKYS